MRSSKFTKVLALIMIFVLGFLTCALSIFGVGYYAASRLSIDKLKDWGVNIDVDKYIDPDAEVSLTAMTLIGLIKEFDAISKIEGELTVERMLDRYGLTLTEGARDKLPTGLMSVDIRILFSKEGIDHVLSNTNVDYLFEFLPEDVLSAPARDTLANKTFKEVKDQGLTYLLEDVHLGYLTGVTYELDDGGEYKVVFRDQNAPTAMELIAPLSVADLLNAVTSNGDVLAVLANDIGDVALESLLGSFMSLDGMPGLFEGTKLEDVLKLDEGTGTYLFDLAAAFEGKLIGDVLGYEPIYLNDTETLSAEPPASPIIIGWKDQNGENVTGIMRGLASASFDSLLGDEGMDVDSMLSEAYFGDVMGYIPVEFDNTTGVPTKWGTADGAEPDAILSSAINKPLGDMMSGDFEVNTLFEGKYVGDAMGYFKSSDDGKWYEDKDLTIELIGINSIVAEIDIGELMAGDGYDVSVVFEGKLGGDLFGYRREEVAGKVVWYDGDVELTGTDRAVANLEIGKLIDTESDYDIAEAFSDLYLGELMGYTQGGLISEATETEPAKYQWKDGDTVVGKLDEKLANYLVGDIMSGDADMDSDEIIDGLTLADIMGYTKKSVSIEGKQDQFIEVWYDGDTRLNGVMSALAEEDINSIATAIDSVTIGDVLGYYQDTDTGEWCEVTVNGEAATLTPATGLILNMAHLTISEMNEPNTVDGVIKGIQISEIMGYTVTYKMLPGGGYETDDQGNKIIDTVTDSEGKQVTGIMKVLAGKTVEELDNDMVDTLSLAEVMGFEERADGWYDGDKKVTGIMAILADTPVPNINDKISTLPLGEVMGYHCADPEDPTSEWLDENNAPVSGIMLAFADLTVDQMSDADLVSQKVQTIKIADALGYYYNEGKWYDDTDKEITGIMATIADTEVGGLNEKIKTIRVCEVLGYYAGVDDHEKWYTTPNRDEQKEATEVTGIMAAIAGFNVNNLGDEIKKLTFGEIIGEGAESGVLKAFKDLTIDDMSDSNKVSATIQGITIADAMGYTDIVYKTDSLGNPEKNSDGDYIVISCKDSSGNPVDGILLAIAGSKVSNLNNAVNSITLESMFGADAFESGFLSLFEPTTTLSELNGDGPNSLTNTFKQKTMGDFAKSGLLDASTIASLNGIDEIKYDKLDKTSQYPNFKQINGISFMDDNGNGVCDQGEIVGWRIYTIDGFVVYLESIFDVIPGI